MAKNKRKARKVSIEELQEHIAEKFEKNGLEFDQDDFSLYDLFEVAPKLEKDLAKITFDFENYTMDPEGFRDLKPLNGWESIEDLAFLGITAGGDWEIPLFFIVYLDHNNTLRGYVPTDGNVFNKTTKEAYGNDEEADEREALKLGFSSFEELYDAELFDSTAVIEDILHRIEVI